MQIVIDSSLLVGVGLTLLLVVVVQYCKRWYSIRLQAKKTPKDKTIDLIGFAIDNLVPDDVIKGEDGKTTLKNAISAFMRSDSNAPPTGKPTPTVDKLLRSEELLAGAPAAARATLADPNCIPQAAREQIETFTGSLFSALGIDNNTILNKLTTANTVMEESAKVDAETTTD